MTDGFNTIGVVGAGLVGCGWAIVFARAGAQVRIFDGDAGVRDSVAQRLKSMLADMEAAGLASDSEQALARITVYDDLAAAVSDVDYVQESTFERIDVKTAVANAIGAAMGPRTIVGSSTSGFPASAFTEKAPNRERFLVVHPVNPPHLVPLVELVPAPWTDATIVPRLKVMMEAVGQVPIVVNREVESFILNRLQGALLNEAFALYADGYASAEDIDKTVRDGLGLRWSFMGPFETIDLNAPGGVADYGARYRAMYYDLAASRTEPRLWTDDVLARLDAERRAALPIEQLSDRTAWRNSRLMALIRHRREQPK